MFYKIRIVADVLECDAYRFVLFHIFPFMNNVYFHRKDNKVFLFICLFLRNVVLLEHLCAQMDCKVIGLCLYLCMCIEQNHVE